MLLCNQLFNIVYFLCNLQQASCIKGLYLKAHTTSTATAGNYSRLKLSKSLINKMDKPNIHVCTAGEHNLYRLIFAACMLDYSIEIQNLE